MMRASSVFDVNRVTPTAMSYGMQRRRYDLPSDKFPQ